MEHVGTLLFYKGIVKILFKHPLGPGANRIK